MKDAYIYDGLRSPFGRFKGGLSSVRPDDLLALVIKQLVERNQFQASEYEDVIAGNSNQAGEDCRNVARFAGLLAGLPIGCGGITVNRLCGSGLASVMDASRCVQSGDGDLFIACGVESMSRAPLVISKAQSAFDRNQTVADSTMGARFTNPLIEANFGADSMPETADNIAAALNITREQCDAFAAASQSKYEAARASGFFEDEMLNVEVPQPGKKPSIVIDSDEHPRATTDIDALTRLRSLYDDGVVTAGNASGINDGASALIIGSKKAGEAHGIQPRARIIASAIAGVEPKLMGLGPVPATKKALARASLELKDMDVIEINEAFASQVLGCLKELNIAENDPRVNANGGAIAVGHPLGASGGRLVLTALRQLEVTNGRYGLITMCIGIGQGIALIIEREG